MPMGSEGGRGGVCFQESVNGGTDVWSSSDSSSSADHLVIMVHGILGSTTNYWKFAANQFVSMLPDKVIVHCSECNMHKLKLDGVDVMGERLTEEVNLHFRLHAAISVMIDEPVIEVVNKRPEVKKISFIAHSIGGLVARYAIGRLYRPPKKNLEECPSYGVYDDNPRGTIIGLEAMNFITIATPHLGSRGNKQVPFFFGFTAIEKVAPRVVHWIFGRTGKHLFLSDNDEGEPPLLLHMVDDYHDLYFMSALQAFRRRVVYANVGYDHIVGWRTSSIRRNSELPMWEEGLHETYPHIVYEELSKGNLCENSAHVNDNFDDLEEKLVSGLKRLSWERVDVSFHNIRLWFDAHNAIQVKDTFMHSDGADVIQHMMDHFLT